MMDARRKKIDLIERLARDAFAEHEIEKQHEDGVYRSFLSKRPRIWTYGFRLTTFPGRLVVSGDIGSLIVERVWDMFEWAPRAVNDINYFASKVPSEMPTREYDPDVAKEWIQELMTQEGTESELAKKAAELEGDIEFEYGEDGWSNPGYLSEKVYASGIVDGCDFPDFTNWTSGYLWQREAVKWFFRNYKPSPYGDAASKVVNGYLLRGA